MWILRLLKAALLTSLNLLLFGCNSGENFAPVVDANVMAFPVSHKQPVIRHQIKPRTDKIFTPQPKPIVSVNKPKVTPVVHTAFTDTWRWPAKGNLIQGFSTTNKGLNIAGTMGDPIYAAASGQVVYCGNGLRGYGNLIIIKHNNVYLSAYAHNQTNLVKEGEWITQGQKIAEMGKSGVGQTMLHFEIRRAGKPVNPITLLHG